MSKDQLALRVEEIITGVEGVAGLYPARSAILAGIARTLGADETLVDVDVSGSRLAVRARIAALTDTAAPRLVREVAAAIRAGLAREPDTSSLQVTVEITVCGFADTQFS
ncbi:MULTISPECIES: hypothetical protein [unclassified Arthrobacter]|uniref:hypothetical protein n=1 Tax=unclassified Arthrobacter TaxID=235627 RepID=UPI0014920B72|nr:MULTISPECIES: hypothetical protein [unclassified Arthrobacter]MBE0009683.1 hypothetical protein [Arthrobacter sp. AET 35A]NOJ59909.1 hypothetical protein [Arthrobacter sp. 260]NOJ63625.1 hypothetical protein [Arthrobacter sp. 147(2020)]